VTSTAAVQAMRAMGLKRIAVGSPYEVASPRLRRFMEQKGMEVTKIEGLVLPTAVHVGRQPVDQFEYIAQRVDSSEADGVFVSCTNFATLARIDAFERKMGKPVITSNQATFWATLRKMKIEDRIDGFGSLLREH
jgi:arylmalonate decarboxylase